MNTELLTNNQTVAYDSSYDFHLTAETTHEERVTIGRSLGRYTGPSQPMNDALNQTVDVIGCLIHPATVTTPTGELKPCFRTVFLLSTDRRLSSCSDAIKRFAEQQLIPLFGVQELRSDSSVICEFTGPVAVLLAGQKTRGGNSTYAPQIV